MKSIFILLLLFLSFNSMAQETTYYVDPAFGDDTFGGTNTSSPFKTIAKAVSAIGSSTGTIYLRGGVYLASSKISLTKTGLATSFIKIWAYQNEKPVIDCSGNSSDGISISGNYYHLKGLEIKKAGHNGINISGNNNIIENCRVHDNGNTGLHITGSAAPGPSNNLILRCDAFYNVDLPLGGNADGFSAKWTVGPGNVFRGCRAYNNSDDGWDIWMCTSTILIDSCYAFRNGVDSWGTGIADANGNGFKLGGNNVATPHTVTNCVSFDNSGNTGRGFDENNNLAGQTVYNCIAFRNKKGNFNFGNNPLTSGIHAIKNCISFQPGNPDVFKNATMVTNSWQGFVVSASDFLSIDTTRVVTQRDVNGKLPQSLFLKLTASSSMIDASVNVGIPFKGYAPDLGAFEYEVITGVKPREQIHSKLDQVFPNPFKIDTSISLFLTTAEKISLKVYDGTNKEVSTIINDTLQPGNHVYKWNAENKPAGIYYCILTTDHSSQTRKMIVVK
jgi:hypothetical protein